MIPFSGIKKEAALHNLKDLALRFFSALGCGALTADGDYLKSMPPECGAQRDESNEAA